MKRGKSDKKGQVWIETVIYLLIAFVMIGLVLSFIRPKIEELRDKAIIEQSLQIINDIDNSIATIGSPGNKRLIEMNIKKGLLKIDGDLDRISFEIESSYTYTEPGEYVQVGNVDALTEDKGRFNLITLERDFSENYNITYKNEDSLKTFTQSSTPYKIYMTNNGETGSILNIDFNLE